MTSRDDELSFIMFLNNEDVRAVEVYKKVANIPQATSFNHPLVYAFIRANEKTLVEIIKLDVTEFRDDLLLNFFIHAIFRGSLEALRALLFVVSKRRSSWIDKNLSSQLRIVIGVANPDKSLKGMMDILGLRRRLNSDENSSNIAALFFEYGANPFRMFESDRVNCGHMLVEVKDIPLTTACIMSRFRRGWLLKDKTGETVYEAASKGANSLMTSLAFNKMTDSSNLSVLFQMTNLRRRNQPGFLPREIVFIIVYHIFD